MCNGLKTTNRGVERTTFALLMAAMAVAEVAFAFGLIARLSWQACALVVLVATTLAAGAVFTVVEMQRLAKEGVKAGRMRGA